ncbi:glycosyltransferase family 2 protein [Paenibacillus sp. N1-5-1-14]|uniref:glycosyltransferase family 2 protein n=1 Tax=Paenibacillus radicibacter TaxID=2972488 RepID=UPI002158D33F|nr:glycosyltransferase family 2 protein [Paenibacillus radicibacter]MCR8643035.1 glycosyltransferase family 2 protein [Paenibacillus radicibacter]
MYTVSKHIAIGSPIHQEPEILKHFLTSLMRLNRGDYRFSFFFVDDNQDEVSRGLLAQFASLVPDVHIHKSTQHDAYIRNGLTHYWNEQLVWKVAHFKDLMIEHATLIHADHLLLVDSDLLFHPDMVSHLFHANKDIVSEIFWTRWEPEAVLQPQVWLWNEYQLWDQVRGEHVSSEEISHRYDRFVSQLREPGVYEVGGLGACTLISKHAMQAGVNYKPIPNLLFWGEDRHFCIRAAALGLTLHVDTHCPAYHIYRDSDLDGAIGFLQETASASTEPIFNWEPVHPSSLESSIDQSHNYPKPLIKRNKLCLSMIVHNESKRYLASMLELHRPYIDEAIIIDDASTDQSASICLDTLSGIPVRLIRNPHSTFHNEVKLRKQLWKETINSDPNWILHMDADEQFESIIPEQIHALLEQTGCDLFSFRLYDMWNKTHYREDEYWRAHLTYRPMLLRYRSSIPYFWREIAQHCGRFPENVFKLPNDISPIRVQHWGWADQLDRCRKFDRYMRLDPEAKYGWKGQYDSILDSNPHLVKWEEGI